MSFDAIPTALTEEDGRYFVYLLHDVVDSVLPLWIRTSRIFYYNYCCDFDMGRNALVFTDIERAFECFEEFLNMGCANSSTSSCGNH